MIFLALSLTVTRTELCKLCWFIFITRSFNMAAYNIIQTWSCIVRSAIGSSPVSLTIFISIVSVTNVSTTFCISLLAYNVY